MTLLDIPASCAPTSICAIVHGNPWGFIIIFAVGIFVGFQLGRSGK